MTEQGYQPKPRPRPELWTFDAATGQIGNAQGEALATVRHAIAGDASDLANGVLMAHAPQLGYMLARLCDALAEVTERAPVDTRRYLYSELDEASGLLDSIEYKAKIAGAGWQPRRWPWSLPPDAGADA